MTAPLSQIPFDYELVGLTQQSTGPAREAAQVGDFERWAE